MCEFVGNGTYYISTWHDTTRRKWIGTDLMKGSMYNQEQGTGLLIGQMDF